MNTTYDYENGQAEAESRPVFGDDGGAVGGELLSSRSSFVESQSRGETDIQISTAHRFPRSVKAFRAKALSLATLDEETAASCFYSLPRDGKAIEGPSARLAEIVAVSWGNLRSQANVVDIDDKWVTARGVCWDLEANVAVSVEVRRRITNKQGRRFNDDMIGVTSNAACAIALRNAVFKVVPMAMAKPIYEAARRVAIGNAQTLSSRRAKMVDHFGKMGVQPDQICQKVNKASVDDITLDDLGTLIGLATAIKDGDTTVDEAFAVEKPANGGGDTSRPKSERMADKLRKPKGENGHEKTPQEAQGSEEQDGDGDAPVQDGESGQASEAECRPDLSLMIGDEERPIDYVARLKKSAGEAQSGEALDRILSALQACWDSLDNAEAQYKAVEKAVEKRRDSL